MKASAERMQQVEELFHAALGRESSQRAGFLEGACAGDEELRSELESLISAHEREGSFIDSPAYQIDGEVMAQDSGTITLRSDDDSKSLVGRTIGHYKVIRNIPGGGMSEVYLAQDTRLGGPAVLKLLPQRYTRDVDRLGRFKQEARAARALNHPNILTIYDIGEVDGIHFIATEYVEGTSLRERILSEKMKLSDVLSVTVQVATALEAAHRAGIVHRDIKPENIMLRTDGIVKVLDFGIAKLVESQQPADPEALTVLLLETAPDMRIGTPQYMSPEQWRGLNIDGRTDIFSLGVVVYEMITGRVPFQGDNPGDASASILKDEPLPLTLYAPETPPELQLIVTKALRKDREERYQSTKELLGDLKGLNKEPEIAAKLENRLQSNADAGQAVPDAARGAALRIREAVARTVSATVYLADAIKRHKRGLSATLVILALVASGLGYFAWQSRKGSGSAAEASSIVALPAKVYGAQELNFLTDAIPSTLSTHLAQVEGLEAKVPPNSFEVERVHGDISKVAEIYGVKTCVVSSVTAEDDRFVLNVQLVEPRSRRVLWSKEYEGRRGSYLELARQAADGIRLALRPAAPPITSGVSLAANSEAELAFRQGQYLWNRYNNQHQPGDFDLALASLKRALDLDPKLADAAADISRLFVFKYEAGAPLQEMLPEIESWAKRAVEINPRCSKGWAALSWVAHSGVPQSRKDLEYALKAVFFGPQEPMAHMELGDALWSDELNLAASLEARRLDPLYLYPPLGAAMYLRCLGRSAEGLPLVDEVLRIEPDMPYGLYEKSLLLINLGRLDEAADLVKRLEKLNAENRFPAAWLIFAQHALALERGNAKAAQAALSEILKTVNDPRIYSFDLDWAARGTVPFLVRHGKTDLAFHILIRSLERGNVPSYDSLMLDSQLAPLQADARFKTIAARSRAQFDEILTILRGPQARSELPPYLEAALADLIKKLGIT